MEDWGTTYVIIAHQQLDCVLTAIDCSYPGYLHVGDKVLETGSSLYKL